MRFAAWKAAFGEEPVLKPVLDVVTRWSSTYYVLLRFCELWAVLSKMPAADLSFDTAEEWLALKQRLERHTLVLPAIIELLQPFFVYTERFSACGESL
jgi:hypothetical protein